jgi:hypothetical protein
MNNARVFTDWTYSLCAGIRILFTLPKAIGSFLKIRNNIACLSSQQQTIHAYVYWIQIPLKTL